MPARSTANHADAGGCRCGRRLGADVEPRARPAGKLERGSALGGAVLAKPESPTIGEPELIVNTSW